MLKDFNWRTGLSVKKFARLLSGSAWVKKKDPGFYRKQLSTDAVNIFQGLCNFLPGIEHPHVCA